MAERGYRYTLTVEGNDYGLLASLHTLAKTAVKEGRVAWRVEDDEHGYCDCGRCIGLPPID